MDLLEAWAQFHQRSTTAFTPEDPERVK